jgi:hypothetical protein
MREARLAPIEGRAEFQAAVIEALDASRHSVTLVDRDFEDWPLESAAGEQALRALLGRGARLQVLVGRRDWLERHGSRFMRLRRLHPALVEIREIPANLRVDESALLGDNQHLVRRAHGDSFHGRLVIASPSEVEPYTDRYRAVWDEATPCLPATTLGL